MKLNHPHWKVSRKTTGAVAVLAIATTVMATPAAMAATARPLAAHASASADFTSARESVTIPAGAAVFHGSAGSARFTIISSPDMRPPTFTCTVDAEPAMGTSTGGEEGIADIECNQTVSEIFLTVYLYENGTVVSSNSVEGHSTNAAEADTLYGPSPGTYYVGAAGQGCISACVTAINTGPSEYLP
jgi:hypothetical protein